MIIDSQLLDTLTSQARMSPRLRMNFDLRNSPNDQSQRMLNAIEPNSVVPVHRHRKSSETIVVVRGRVCFLLFDKMGCMEESVELNANGPCFAINVPVGQWHTLNSLESGTIIMETKDGPYEPTSEEDIMNL